MVDPVPSDPAELSGRSHSQRLVIHVRDGRERLHLDGLIGVSEVCIPTIMKRAQLRHATGC